MRLFGPLEGNKNELRQVAVQTLVGVPANPVVGQIYREGADGLVYMYQGAGPGWVYIGAIIDGSVTTAKIGNAQVTQAKLANLSVGTAQLIDGSVTLAKHAADSVDASKIVDGSVGTAELANLGVTLAKLAALSVDATKLVDGAVTLAKMAADSVDASKIVDLSVGTAELANLAVTAAKIANGTITSAQIAAAAGITKAQLANLGIVDADIAAGAAIAKTKLAALNIVNADISAGAAIALSKLATDPLARANHTGTQLAATISDFAAAVRAAIAVADTASLDLTWNAGTGTLSGVVLDSPSLGGVAAAGYEKLANKNVANGYAGLGADGKLPDGLLPALALSDTFVVGSQAAMLALAAQTGDVAVRTDQNKSYILTANNAGVLANWQEILSPNAGGTVTSVTATGPIVSTGGNNPVISLADDGITQAKMADNSVGTAEIIDGNVTLAKLAPNSVDASKIVDGSVGAAEIADGSVGTAELADGSVTDAKVAAGIAVAKVTGAVQKRVATIGDGVASSFVVTHNLASQALAVTVRDAAAPFEQVYPSVFMTDVNTCTINFNGFVPGVNAFHVTVLG